MTDTAETTDIEEVMIVTDAARETVLEIRAKEDDAEGLGLRVEVTGISGVDYTYDRATTFDIRIDGGSTPVEASVRQIVEVLTARGMLRG